MEYIIYCDESDADGQFYGNFYGGMLVRSPDLEQTVELLESKKAELNLQRELKWQRVTGNYLDKYLEFSALLFDLIAKDKLKARVMFTQNIHRTGPYDEYRREYKYFLLYYQFIKHAFGLRYAPAAEKIARVRVYLDKMPDTREKVESFKDHIESLNKNAAIQRNRIMFQKEQIAEIDSKDHVLAQSLDIILGAMQFRLNDKHLEKPKGQRFRGKRTIAKEKLYKYINSRIRQIHPGFNIGVSTGTKGEIRNRWHHSYRHWLFVPAGAEIDTSLGKSKK
ncbi:MAG TPA: hypothetical protein DEG76_13945 [Pseudohongiella sp.]|nr:hypothetical protein [Pseudohongiella sp.]HBX38315.1 hypothetical protein [Pseudohongiella sp.]|tara:strand:- start:401 stop:1237 length:837 start_codon:yes stop_codon:yes gene_type:complete